MRLLFYTESIFDAGGRPPFLAVVGIHTPIHTLRFFSFRSRSAWCFLSSKNANCGLSSCLSGLSFRRSFCVVGWFVVSSVDIGNQMLTASPASLCSTSQCECFAEEAGTSIQCTDILTSIPVVALPGIVRLVFERNAITELPSNMLTSIPTLELNTIALGGNSISRIAVDAFRFTPAVEVLTLQKNRLTELPVGLFTFLPKLTLLNIQNNQFFSAPAFPPMISLNQLLIDANSFRPSRAMLQNFPNLLLLSAQQMPWGLDGVPGDLLDDNPLVTSVDLGFSNLASLPDNLFNSCFKSLTILVLDVSHFLETLLVVHGRLLIFFLFLNSRIR